MAEKTLPGFYRDYRFSRGGIAASAMGLFSMVILAALVGMSARAKTTLAPWSGALGIAAFCVGLMGVSVGLSSFHESCRSYLFSKLGTIYCGLMSACWFLVFCIGIT